MKRSPFVIGLIFLGLAVAIFIFADGLRRFYSGGFFLILAVFLLISSRKRVAVADHSSDKTND